MVATVHATSGIMVYSIDVVKQVDKYYDYYQGDFALKIFFIFYFYFIENNREATIGSFESDRNTAKYEARTFFYFE
jgi:hypothetical protein